MNRILDLFFGRAARFASLAACLIALVLVAGCVPFEGKFAAATADAANPDEPLSGGWVGTWEDQAGAAGRPARAVVEVAPGPACNVWIEMSGYRNVIANWIEAPGIPIEKRPDGTEHFHVKVPLESRPKQDVWAVAIELDGERAGDALSIRFRTNDAMRQLDEGIIRLRRPAR